jgi:hypothetical protein
MKLQNQILIIERRDDRVAIARATPRCVVLKRTRLQ